MLAKLAQICATTGSCRRSRLKRASPPAPCLPSTGCSPRQSSSAQARPGKKKMLQEERMQQQPSHLWVPEPVFVWDVIGDASLTPGLSPGAPWLHLQLLATFLDRKDNYERTSQQDNDRKCSLKLNLEGGKSLLGPPWQVDMDRSTHASSQVGGAGVKVAIPGWSTVHTKCLI